MNYWYYPQGRRVVITFFEKNQTSATRLRSKPVSLSESGAEYAGWGSLPLDPPYKKPIA